MTQYRLVSHGDNANRHRSTMLQYLEKYSFGRANSKTKRMSARVGSCFFQSWTDNVLSNSTILSRKRDSQSLYSCISQCIFQCIIRRNTSKNTSISFNKYNRFSGNRNAYFFDAARRAFVRTFFPLNG